ncbi:MAG TPA: hypothetical protein VK402_00515 [Blastococcus sp.]|nr:hypothetical protein [Blastococcus sp.]
MSSPDPAPGDSSADAHATRLRWIGRGVVAAIALWFIADGLRGLWPGAGTVAQVLIVVGALLVLAFGVVGALYLARRGRQG